MGGRALAIVVGAAVALGVAEREAEACICSGRSDLVAPVDGTHPEGASLVFAQSCGGAMATWQVTVDGEPATLVGGDVFQGIGAVSIEPAPAAGAEVVLSQGCDGVSDDEPCNAPEQQVERARFVIGAPDETAPPAADLVAIDDEEGEFSESCDPPTHDLRFDAVARFGAVEPGAWALVAFTRDGTIVHSESREIPSDGDLSSTLLAHEDDYAGSEVCVEAAAIDASANASATQRACTTLAAASEQGCAMAEGSRGSAAALGLFLVWRARRRRRSEAAVGEG